MQQGDTALSSSAEDVQAMLQPPNTDPDGGGGQDNSHLKTVGKITYYRSKVLGPGCDGTIVYRGKYRDGENIYRDVAVKRIVGEKLAMSEVTNLIKLKTHQNVVGYVGLEEDMDFRYIALDLCEATLNDWVEGNFPKDKMLNKKISGVQVLKDASKGLAHLHKQNVLHRDVKPGNILFQARPDGNFKAVISDFGISKKFESKTKGCSYSGLRGTENWIAPEVYRNLPNNDRVKHDTAVDVFSMGLVYYYVLTYELLGTAHHAFGTEYFCQPNIQKNKLNLSHVDQLAYWKDIRGAIKLIEMMLSPDPKKRPSIEAVLKHLLFWPDTNIRAFFKDIISWMENQQDLAQLEGNCGAVVGEEGWMSKICYEVGSGLRGKHNTYSVKDLLRALRNTETHFDNKTEATKLALGGSRNQSVLYWLNRFPALLPYTWGSFYRLSQEEDYKCYYHLDFDCTEYLKGFSKPAPKPPKGHPTHLRPPVRQDAASSYEQSAENSSAVDIDNSKTISKEAIETVVHLGEFRGRPVAIKSSLAEEYFLNFEDIKLVNNSPHPNIACYFPTDYKNNRFQIAMDLCYPSLANWVEGDFTNEKINGIQVLKEASEGLSHLHKLGIVHKNLKQTNILLRSKANEKHVAIISDYWVCIKPEQLNIVTGPSDVLQGFDERSLDQIKIAKDDNSGTEITPAMDVFSMGQIYSYVLNFIHNKKSSTFSEDKTGAIDLIKMMLSPVPEKRPTVQTILKHPMFWCNARKMEFFGKINDLLKTRNMDTCPPIRKFIEEGRVFVKNDWTIQICRTVTAELDKQKQRKGKYKGNSVRDLLLAFTTARVKYDSMGKEAQAALGKLPDGFMDYWMKRFPYFLYHTWTSFEELKRDANFADYYPIDVDYSNLLCDA